MKKVKTVRYFKDHKGYLQKVFANRMYQTYLKYDREWCSNGTYYRFDTHLEAMATEITEDDLFLEMI